MGQMLDKPDCRKESGHEEASGSLELAWASSCMQGWRIGMEDAHICLPSLPGNGLWKDVAMFGVMDGHGGEQVAKYCSRRLPEECVAYPFEEGDEETEVLQEALIGCFQRMDERLHDRVGSMEELQSLTNPPSQASLRRSPSMGKVVNADMVGCTCCLSCITAKRIAVGNAGDSRAVVSRAGRAVALSEDHKPNMPTERQRIEAAGGTVEAQPCSTGTQYRVNGNLNLSRALGDLHYKKDKTLGPEAQIISGTPDVTFLDRSEEDEFMVVCCDGVWDMKTNQEVVDFVRRRLVANPSMDSEGMARILEDLLDACVSRDLKETKGLGGDNMTALLVRFPGAPTLRSVPCADAPGNPSLLGVKPKHSSDTDGSLLVRLGLPGGWALGDFVVDISEPKAELMVHGTDGREPWRISLQEHLPDGAQLVVSEAPVKFCAKSRTLRARLPWQVAAAA